jgi:spore germination protein GerM
MAPMHISPMSSLRSPRALLIVLAAALVALAPALAGCGDDAAPATSASLYFVDPEGLLAEEKRLVSGDDVLPAALDELAAGPEDPDLRPALPEGARAVSAEVAGSIALVDMNAAFADGFPGGGAQAQTEALAPLVYTATGIDGVTSLSITVEGDTPQITGLAFDLTEPISRADLPISLAEDAP